MTAPESETVALPLKPAPPIEDEELAALFSSLVPYRLLVVAVSGGVDSTALMHLVARWLRGLEGRRDVPRVVVATVDHGLRPESSAEARHVSTQAATLGLEHRTVLWTGEKPTRGIQDAARMARYDLLSRLATTALPAAVVTAHTEDDQAETLLMRLARGSGLDGLAAMPLRRQLDEEGEVDLVRPLLGVSKARLRATLEAQRVLWIEDPSNDSPVFERVRLRAVRQHFEAAGLTSEKLALAARRLDRARHALDTIVGAFCASHVTVDAAACGSLDRATFAEQPADVRIRVLARLLDALGGAGKAARLSQIEDLDRILDDGSPLALTLGGCLVSCGSKVLRICREPGARDLPVLALAPGEDVTWDKRFRLSAPAHLAESHYVGEGAFAVRALGMPAYATLRPVFGCRLPSRPAASLPAIWSGATLVGVPDVLWDVGGPVPAKHEFMADGHQFSVQPFSVTFLPSFGGAAAQ